MNQSIFNIGTGNLIRVNSSKPSNQYNNVQAQLNEYQNYPECSICNENMIGNLSVLVPCGHVFHKKCLQEYQRLDCPMCRAQNKQAIQIHFSIESNLIQRRQPIKQNKLFQSSQFDSQNNINKEFYQNLRSLVCKGKESIDRCYYQNIWQNWNTQNEKQKLISCESLHTEISNILTNLKNEIDNQSYSDYRANPQNQIQQPQTQQNFIKPSQKIFQNMYFDQKSNLNLVCQKPNRSNVYSFNKLQKIESVPQNRPHIFNEFE